MLPPFQTLVEVAILAPSPDNNQPWRFTLEDQAILVEHDRERALPSDVDGMFDLTGIGAAIENISLKAQASGLATDVASLMDPGDHPRFVPVARLTFHQTDAPPDPLVEQIEQRHTNRAPYAREPIAADIVEEIRAAAEALPTCHWTWIDDRTTIAHLARLVGQADVMRFRRRPFHEELVRQLRFTLEEAETSRTGLDIRTLALPPGGSLLLKTMRSWRRTRCLDACGLGFVLSRITAGVVRSSGAIAILRCEQQDQPQGYLSGGRALQRAWLAATRYNLAVHPLGSLPIFLQHLEQRNISDPREREVLEEAQELLQRVSSTARPGVVQMLLRIGRTARVAPRSLRLGVDGVTSA
jgi:nitroreductase